MYQLKYNTVNECLCYFTPAGVLKCNGLFLRLSFCPVLVRRANESTFKPECSSINLLSVQHYPLNSHQGLQIRCKTIFCQIEAVNGSKVFAYLGHLLSIKHSKLRKAALWQTKWYFSCLEELYVDHCFQCRLWKELFFFFLWDLLCCNIRHCLSWLSFANSAL